jgi:energy-coupling factor transporter ATP-binding protein EcfA2
MNAALTATLPDVVSKLPHGSLLALIGVTGSGKSMALRHLAARCLKDGDPAIRLFELSGYAKPEAVLNIYSLHLAAGAAATAIWTSTEQLPSTRVVVLEAAIEDQEKTLEALALIESAVTPGSLVVIDEVRQVTASARHLSALAAVIAKGARVLTTAQITQELPPVAQDTLHLIWCKGRETKEQQMLHCMMGHFADLNIDGTVYHFSPSAEEYWLHTVHPDDCACLARAAGPTLRDRIAAVIARRTPKAGRH